LTLSGQAYDLLAKERAGDLALIEELQERFRGWRARWDLNPGPSA